MITLHCCIFLYVVLTIKTLAGLFILYDVNVVHYSSWLWFTRCCCCILDLFFSFLIFFTTLCILIIIYIFTECHVSLLTLPTWLTLRIFSQNTLTSCHAPVSLDQSEPGLESWRPMGGGLVTCDEGRGDMTHHISSPSVRSPSMWGVTGTQGHIINIW